MYKEEATRQKISPAKTLAIAVGALAFFGFLCYNVYLDLFVYTSENPARHDVRVLDDAEDGDAHSQYLMGVYLTTGRQGIKPDQAAAQGWFEASAAQNHAGAKYRLGDIHRRGIGVGRDMNKAISFFRQAVDGGSYAAMNAMGDLFKQGEGVKADPDAALTWYHRAADGGYAVAQRNIGLMAANGRGMPRDYAAAMAWYLRAVQQTDAVAITNVGIMYEHGQGVDADPLRAWDCYYTAALWQHAGAKRHRERIEERLPAEWRAKGLYERDGRDCLSGGYKKLTRPISRVRRTAEDEWENGEE